jgi:hypothetical protein
LTDQECLALFIAMGMSEDEGCEAIMSPLMKDDQKTTELYRDFREKIKNSKSDRKVVVNAVHKLCNGKMEDTKQFRQMCFMHMWSAQMLEDANRWRVGRATRQAKAGEKTDVVFCNT